MQLIFVIVARWIHPFGFVASLAFGLLFAYLTIVTGRWLFGGANCEGSRRPELQFLARYLYAVSFLIDRYGDQVEGVREGQPVWWL